MIASIIIECLKRSGLEIKDIKQFMDWCVEGAATYPQRKELFEKQKKLVEAEIEHISRVLNMIKFKCLYYEQALQDGNEDRVHSMIPDKLPEDIQKMYDHAHKEYGKFNSKDLVGTIEKMIDIIIV